MCGVSPVERSSGSRQCRRLNRGGGRQANAACTGSCRPACAPTRAPGTTTNAAARRARRGARQSEVSSPVWPGRFSTWSDVCTRNPRFRSSRET
ncbi:hypothetical protein ACFT8V_13950 [Streptomyces griseoincarnatus]